jgi:hypothetical protein
VRSHCTSDFVVVYDVAVGTLIDMAVVDSDVEVDTDGGAEGIHYELGRAVGLLMLFEEVQ